MAGGGFEWTGDLVRRLGVEPDRVIAREVGVNQQLIRRKRIALGIPALPATEVGRSAVWSVPANAALLGTAPDSAIAKQLGLSQGVVASARIKRGIPAHPDTRAYTRSAKDYKTGD